MTGRDEQDRGAAPVTGLENAVLDDGKQNESSRRLIQSLRSVIRTKLMEYGLKPDSLSDDVDEIMTGEVEAVLNHLINTSRNENDMIGRKRRRTDP